MYNGACLPRGLSERTKSEFLSSMGGRDRALLLNTPRPGRGWEAGWAGAGWGRGGMAKQDRNTDEAKGCAEPAAKTFLYGAHSKCLALRGQNEHLMFNQSLFLSSQ